MIQAHQGFLKTEVQLIADNSLLIKIPTNRKITILWEEISENKIPAQTDEEEITKRQEMVKSLKGCLAGYEVDLAQIKEERITKRGLLK